MPDVEESASILIVDDEASVRDVLERALSAAGYSCRSASDVPAALAAMESAPADLVLSDIMMPGVTGIDLLAEVRSRWSDTVMVMITAVASAQSAIDAMKLGAEDYIIKPFNLTEVVLAAERALEKRSLRIANRDYRESLEKKVEEQTAEVRSTFLGAVRSLVEALEAKDPYTNGHSRRVTEISVTMAREIGLGEDEIQKIRLAGQVHDIGKIGIPEAVLNKPGKLTEEEYSCIKGHPEMGEKILMPIIRDRDILDIVKCHHERFDGCGYPARLKGENIPLGARLMSVADAFDAMTSNRSYRRAMAPEQARQQLLDGKGSQFDPDAVDILIRIEDQQGLPFCPVTGRPEDAGRKLAG